MMRLPGKHSGPATVMACMVFHRYRWGILYTPSNEIYAKSLLKAVILNVTGFKTLHISQLTLILYNICRHLTCTTALIYCPRSPRDGPGMPVRYWVAII